MLSLGRDQGSLRYALLDVATLRRRIVEDFRETDPLGAGIRMDVAVTCLDQLPELARWTCDGEQVAGSPDALVYAIVGDLPA